MSSEAVREIVETRLNDQWAAATPIAWDNVDYKPQPGVSFIRCIIEGTFSEIMSMTCQREYYQLEVQILTPSGEGTKKNMELADQVNAIFVGYQEGNLVCKQGYVARQGDLEEWHNRKVFIEMQYDNHFN